MSRFASCYAADQINSQSADSFSGFEYDLGQRFTVKKEVHIGFVVSPRNGGILVSAIHNADIKSLDEIMAALNDIIPRARALKLHSSELNDATLTVTSIGDCGTDTIFGVIYPPRCDD